MKSITYLSFMIFLLFSKVSLSQNYLFNDPEDGKAAATGPFKGTALTMNLAKERASIRFTGDLKDFDKNKQKSENPNLTYVKSFYYSINASGKSNEGLINVTTDNELNPELSYGGELGLKINRQFEFSANGFEIKTSRVYWVSAGYGHSYDELSILDTKNSLNEQLIKKQINNNSFFFTLGHFSKSHTQKNIQNKVATTHVVPDPEKKTYSLFAVNIQYQDRANNKDDLKQVEISDLFYQKNFNDTIRTVEMKKTALVGDFQFYNQLDFRIDYTLVPSWFDKEPVKKTSDCVECCKDPDPQYNIAVNIYAKQSYRKRTFDYTALGLTISILQDIDELFSKEKGIGNKIKFTGGIGIEFRQNWSEKALTQVQAIPTLRSGITF